MTPSTRNVELGVVRCPRSVASRWRSFTGSRCVILLSLQPGEDVGVWATNGIMQAATWAVDLCQTGVLEIAQNSGVTCPL